MNANFMKTEVIKGHKRSPFYLKKKSFKRKICNFEITEITIYYSKFKSLTYTIEANP